MDKAVKIRKRRSANRAARHEKRKAAQKFLYLPEVQRTKPGTAAIGYICRALTAWIGVWGLLLFLSDAFLFEVDAKFLALASIVPVALLAVALYNGIGTLIMLAGSAASAALYIVLIGKPVEHAVASVMAVYNTIGDRLYALGYRAPIAAEINFSALPVGTEFSDLIRTGLVFLAILLAAIVTLACVRRVHLLPIIITGGSICVLVFTYNLVNRSWGFTLMLTALCGLLVMHAYESFFREAPQPKAKRKRKAKKPSNVAAIAPEAEPEAEGAKTEESKPAEKPRSRWLSGAAKSSAFGGYASLAAMLVAFLVLLIPTMSVRKKWGEIESINSKMEIARQILSSVIVGDVPDFSDLGYLGKMDLLTSRTTTASDRVFTGAKVLEVRTNYNTPVYMRSFVSSKFENDRWLVPSNDEIKEFYSRFGYGFVGERIAKNFFDTINPRLSGISNYTSYSTRYDFGFVTTPVDIKLLSSSGNLLFMPSRYDPDIALLEFAGIEGDAYGEEYSDYSDGIVTTSWFNFNKSYRALSYVQSYRHEKVFANLIALDDYYNLCRDYIERTMADDLYYGEKVKSEILELGLETLAEDNIYERWYAMDEADRGEFYERFILADKYGKYVRDNYTYVPESEAPDIFKLALTALKASHPDLKIDPSKIQQIKIDDGKIYVQTTELNNFTAVSSLGAVSKLSVYDKVMAVIDYLKDNYTYTLTPKDPSSEDLSSVKAFLLDTKEGYCVQFATAAALMLRTLGVPTRYCEGYIAPDFSYEKAYSAEGRYVCTVRDYNAHAWIEVYADDIGWLTFETTPEYYAGMYEHYSLSVDPRTGGYETPEYTEPEDIDIDEEETTKVIDTAKIFAFVIIGLLAAGAIGVGVYFVRKFVLFVRESRYRREMYIETVLRSSPEGLERRYAALAIIDYINAALAAAGLRPRTGELPSEYRERCRRVLLGEEAANEARIKLPGAAGELAEKIIAMFAEWKRQARLRKAAKSKAKRRGGSLGIADEYTASKGKPSVPGADIEKFDFARLFDSIQREEFGPGMSNEDLKECARFLLALSNKVYSELNPIFKLWYRHIKHTV